MEGPRFNRAIQAFAGHTKESLDIEDSSIDRVVWYVTRILLMLTTLNLRLGMQLHVGVFLVLARNLWNDNAPEETDSDLGSTSRIRSIAMNTICQSMG